MSPNGLNINESCGSTHPKSLQKAVLEHQADLGVAFDGDADRVILVDQSRSSKLIGDHILYILSHARLTKTCGYCRYVDEQYGAWS